MPRAKSDPYPMGFLVCGEFKTALNRLTILQKGMVFDALLRDLDREPPSPEMDPMALLMFEAILPSVHRIQQKRLDDAETSRRNGMGGGRPRKTLPDQPPPEDVPPVETYETEGFPEEPAGFEENLEVPKKTCGFFEEPRGFQKNPTKQNITEQNGTPLNGTPPNNHEPREDPKDLSLGPSTPGRLPERNARKRVSPAPKADLRKEEFARWYAAYPRHKNPADAERAWEKAAKAGDLPADINVMLDALTWQRTQAQWQDPHYIPYPATYLNKKAWLEEPDKAPPRPASLPIYGNGGPTYHRPSQEEIAARRTYQNGMEILAEMEEEERRRNEGCER